MKAKAESGEPGQPPEFSNAGYLDFIARSVVAISDHLARAGPLPDVPGPGIPTTVDIHLTAVDSGQGTDSPPVRPSTIRSAQDESLTTDEAVGQRRGPSAIDEAPTTDKVMGPAVHPEQRRSTGAFGTQAYGTGPYGGGEEPEETSGLTQRDAEDSIDPAGRVDMGYGATPYAFAEATPGRELNELEEEVIYQIGSIFDTGPPDLVAVAGPNLYDIRLDASPSQRDLLELQRLSTMRRSTFAIFVNGKHAETVAPRDTIE